MIPDAWLEAAALDERNADNVTRTDAYLELYAHLRGRGVELPWILMAHLVSRNAGYMMTDLARQLDRDGADDATKDAMRTLFLLLERGNFLIFYDAWHHLGRAISGRLDELRSPRTPIFMIDAWRRYQAGASDERALVLDLVHNEQHLIERRAVHHPHLAAGARLLALIEMSGREKPLHFPVADAPAITVGGFASVDKRIAAGRRIFDEVVADRGRRDALFAWALAHPHTGSRAVHGGKPGPTLREAWPIATVRALWDGIHAPMEPDPAYP
jgi:Protein of unknown function (DUF2515)